MALEPVTLYVFGLAILLALLEIQIEGKHGWAERLPTWRATKNNSLAKWLFQLSGKTLTGYHVALFSLLLAFFHFPFVLGAPITIEAEVKLLSLFFSFVVLWDLLWFILNPHFTIKKFTKRHIPWHRNWLFGLPTEYWLGLGVSLLVLVPAALLGYPNLFEWWVKNTILFIVLIIVVIFLTLQTSSHASQEQDATS